MPIRETKQQGQQQQQQQIQTIKIEGNRKQLIVQKSKKRGAGGSNSRVYFPGSYHLPVHIQRNLHFLKQLACCGKNPSRCATLLASAGPEQLLCLVECCLNLLRGRVPINRRRLEALRPHAAQIRALSRSRSAESVRKQLAAATASQSHLQRQKQGGPAQTGRGIPLIPLVVGSLLPIIIEKVIH